jgi:predicted ATPase
MPSGGCEEEVAERLVLPVAVARSVFVGRLPELRALRGSVDQAIAGNGRLLLLGGAPGIGKTRTCEEAAAYACARGARVLWGRCYEGEGAPALWPWVQILRACVRSLEADALREALGGAGPELAALVPTLRQRLPDTTAPLSPESPQARFRLFDGVARFLENVARRTPMLIVLDDLHGADHPSLLLLQFVVQQLRAGGARCTLYNCAQVSAGRSARRAGRSGALQRHRAGRTRA